MLGGNILMKTFFRVTVLGLLMVVLTAFSVSAVMAQDGNDDQKEKETLYKCFVDNYDKNTIEQKEKAIDCAKQYIAKFKDDTQYVKYFEEAIPDLEKWIKDEIKRKEVEKKRLEDEKRINRFDTAYRAAVGAKTDIATKWAEAFAAGDDLIKNNPSFALDAKIILASAGKGYLAQAEPPIDTYNNKTIAYAEEAISDLESGKKSDNFGAYNYIYKTKENALGEMNFIIGFIKYVRQEKKDEGVKYFYKATQHESDAKKNTGVYKSIGSWYLSKAGKIGDKRKAVLAKNKAIEEDATLTEEEKKAKIDANIAEAQELFALEKGYADRAIDAYARAHALSKDANDKAAIFTTLKGLFEFRYNDPKDELKKSEANINSYVASVNTKTMPNPATEVEPVKTEEEAPSDKPADTTKEEAKSSDNKSGATRSRTVSKTSTDNQ